MAFLPEKPLHKTLKFPGRKWRRSARCVLGIECSLAGAASWCCYSGLLRSIVQYPTMAKKNSVRSAGKRWLGAGLRTAERWWWSSVLSWQSPWVVYTRLKNVRSHELYIVRFCFKKQCSVLTFDSASANTFTKVRSPVFSSWNGSSNCSTGCKKMSQNS